MSPAMSCPQVSAVVRGSPPEVLRALLDPMSSTTILGPALEAEVLESTPGRQVRGSVLGVITSGSRTYVCMYVCFYSAANRPCSCRAPCIDVVLCCLPKQAYCSSNGLPTSSSDSSIKAEILSCLCYLYSTLRQPLIVHCVEEILRSGQLRLRTQRTSQPVLACFACRCCASSCRLWAPLLPGSDPGKLWYSDC